MRTFQPGPGAVVQAYRFALDPTPQRRLAINRQFGGRRFAYNWTVRTLKNDIDPYHENGTQVVTPSPPGRSGWSTAAMSRFRRWGWCGWPKTPAGWNG